MNSKEFLEYVTSPHPECLTHIPMLCFPLTKSDYIIKNMTEVSPTHMKKQGAQASRLLNMLNNLS